MTVLGNIVAVASIVAVVSLIQRPERVGQDAILNQAGADSFSIQQFPLTLSDEEFDKVRYNPRITQADARAIRRYSLARRRRSCCSRRASGQVTRGDKSIDGVNIHGVSSEFGNLSTFKVERGRLMNPIEVERSRPVAVIGWEVADLLFGGVDPLDKLVQIEGVHFRVIGVSPKRGAFLGRSQDDFAVIPLGQFQVLFGSRPQLSVAVKPRDIAQLPAAIDEATVALRIARRLKPRQPDNFGIFTSDTSSTSTIGPPTASSRCWSASSRCRSSSEASSS